MIFKIKRFIEIDSCLDKGGKWDYELNECYTLDYNDKNLRWFTDYDTINGFEYVAKGTLVDEIGSSPYHMIQILNTRPTECKIELDSISNDTINIKISNDEFLTEQMGSCGANCFLGETVYSLTDNELIKYVKIDMNEGSHASPGVYNRTDFWELVNNAKIKIIGAWGDDDNGNAIFAFYEDSVYYPDPNNWYKYDLNQDTLIFTEEDGIKEKVIIERINCDSMTLKYVDYGATETYRKR
jgi:hypothetical protein